MKTANGPAAASERSSVLRSVSTGRTSRKENGSAGSLRAWAERPATSHTEVPTKAKAPNRKRAICHPISSAMGAARNIAVATPVVCPARFTPLITGSSPWRNHWTEMALVAGKTRLTPIPNTKRNATTIQKEGANGVSIPTAISRPPSAIALRGPILATTIPPGMRNTVSTTVTAATSKLTVPRLMS